MAAPLTENPRVGCYSRARSEALIHRLNASSHSSSALATCGPNISWSARKGKCGRAICRKKVPPTGRIPSLGLVCAAWMTSLPAPITGRPHTNPNERVRSCINLLIRIFAVLVPALCTVLYLMHHSPEEAHGCRSVDEERVMYEAMCKCGVLCLLAVGSVVNCQPRSYARTLLFHTIRCGTGFGPKYST
jgi:hypothetical protein